MYELNYYEEDLTFRILKFIKYYFLFLIAFKIRFFTNTIFETIYTIAMLFIIGRKFIFDYNDQLKVHNPHNYIFNKRTLRQAIIGITVIFFIFSVSIVFVLKESGNDTPVMSLIEFYKSHGFRLIETFYFTSIFEEIIFRGIYFNLFNKLMEKKGKFISSIINSIIFSAIHFKGNLYNSVGVFIYSVIYGLVYLNTKDVKYPMLLHCITNAILLFQLIKTNL